MENIDIDKEILENIDIDRILNRSEFGKPDRAYHTEPKDRRLSAESPTALSQPNQRKLLYQIIWSLHILPRSVMLLPDVNQIMPTHIAVSCQISINAGRGERQNWTTIISSGQSQPDQARFSNYTQQHTLSNKF